MFLKSLFIFMHSVLGWASFCTSDCIENQWAGNNHNHLTHISWDVWAEDSPTSLALLEDPHRRFPASPAKASSEQHIPWAERAARHAQALDALWQGCHAESRSRAPRWDNGWSQGRWGGIKSGAVFSFGFDKNSTWLFLVQGGATPLKSSI